MEDVARRMAEAAADAAGFERRLCRSLEELLVGRRSFTSQGNRGVWVECVRVEGGYPETRVTLVLRDEERPGCAFLWDGGRIWDPESFELASSGPEEMASWLALHLEEDVEAVSCGLPTRCPVDPTWVNPRRMALEEAAARAPFPLMRPERLPAPADLLLVYEERRRSFPFATAHLVFEYPEGAVVSCQTERLRQRVPQDGWHRVDRQVRGKTWTAWLLLDPDPWFTLRPGVRLHRLVRLHFRGFSVYLQTDFLDANTLLAAAFSLRPA